MIKTPCKVVEISQGVFCEIKEKQELPVFYIFVRRKKAKNGNKNNR
jgi:hypothetical protein